MLFDRVASLVIGKPSGKAIEIRDLRFAFSIEKGTGENPNKCTCEVYNLNPDSRALVETVNNVLILKAGYAQDVGEITIFTGTVTRSITKRMGADWVTSLEMSDGGLEYRDKKTTFSYAPGITGQAVLANIAATFGLPVRPLPSAIASKTYPEGFAFVGRSREAMSKACEYLGLEWSIQNREVQILKKGKAVEQQAFVLSPETGMIDSPESEVKTMTDKAAAKKGVTTKQKGVRESFGTNDAGDKNNKLEVQGYKVKTLLQPALQPGGYVRVDSKSIKSQFFRVESLTHEGDTHGQAWYSDLILRYT
jgi:hypothetical protein